jgi:hypothetical protein
MIRWMITPPSAAVEITVAANPLAAAMGVAFTPSSVVGRASGTKIMIGRSPVAVQSIAHSSTVSFWRSSANPFVYI